MKTGRPKTTITLDSLIEVMRFYPTLEETASWFQCSTDTIERHIKSLSGLTFKEFRSLHSGKTRLLLKRKAISMALEQNDSKMLIYCLRALTDMKDSQDSKSETDPSGPIIRLGYALPKLES